MASLLTGHVRSWWQDLTTSLFQSPFTIVQGTLGGRTRINPYCLQLILPTNATSLPSVKNIASKGIWAETQKCKAIEGLAVSLGIEGTAIKHN